MRRSGFEDSNGEWQISSLVDNLTDGRAALYKFEVPTGAITVNRPREYGMKRWGSD